MRYKQSIFTTLSSIVLSLMLICPGNVYAVEEGVRMPMPALGQNPTPEIVTGNEETKKMLSISYPVQSETDIEIMTQKSQLLIFDETILRAAVANPDVADILPISPTEIIVVGKVQGVTTLIVWVNGDDSYLYNISVRPDPKHLLTLLRSVAPTGSFDVYPTDTSYAVRGYVDSNETIEKVMEVAESFAPGAVNMLKVRNPKQVLLEIRVAEINRSKAERMGVDLQFIARNYALTMLTGGAVLPAFDNTDALFLPEDADAAFGSLLFPTGAPSSSTPGTTFGFRQTDGNDLKSATIEALQEAQVLKVIARPNLLAKDGEEASFLVGGEFPIVVVTNNTINIEFKEFGTRLTFKPEFLDEKTIQLSVEPEVSELDSTNGVTLSGITVPALTTRRTKTVVDLENKQSFVLAGLLFETITQVHEKIPILGDIPFLGSITKRVADTSTEKELIIMVTPHIVSPMGNFTERELYPSDEIRKTVKYIDAQNGGLELLKLNENVTDITEDIPRLLEWQTNDEGAAEKERTLKQAYEDIRDTIRPKEKAKRVKESAPEPMIEDSSFVPSAYSKSDEESYLDDLL